MNRIDHEREMTRGWIAFRDGETPDAAQFGEDTPYMAGYRAARAKYARDPKRFRRNWKPPGVGPRKKDGRVQVTVMTEQQAAKLAGRAWT